MTPVYGLAAFNHFLGSHASVIGRALPKKRRKNF
jgi:hypothetical protein